MHEERRPAPAGGAGGNTEEGSQALAGLNHLHGVPNTVNMAVLLIARISRGRSVPEFVTCVLIIPTGVSVIWMSAFGGGAIEPFLDGDAGVQETVVACVPEMALFRMLEPLPLSGVLAPLGIVLVVLFFVTSSDSGSLVIDTITAGGKIDAPVAQRVFWAVFEGLVAIVLLLLMRASAFIALRRERRLQ